MKIRKKFKKGKNYVTANALKLRRRRRQRNDSTMRRHGKIETSKKRKINKNKK
jgi:hypothetical protein